MEDILPRKWKFETFPSWLQLEVLKRHPERYATRDSFTLFLEIKEKEELQHAPLLERSFSKERDFISFLLNYNEHSFKGIERPEGEIVEELFGDMHLRETLFNEIKTPRFYRALYAHFPHLLCFVPKCIQETLVGVDDCVANPALVRYLHSLETWELFRDPNTAVKCNPNLIRYFPLSILKKISMNIWKEVIERDLELMFYLPLIGKKDLLDLAALCQLRGISQDLFITHFPPWLYCASTSPGDITFFVDPFSWGYDLLDLKKEDIEDHLFLEKIYSKLIFFNRMMTRETNPTLASFYTHSILLQQPERTAFLSKKRGCANLKKQRQPTAWFNSSSNKEHTLEALLKGVKDVKL